MTNKYKQDELISSMSPSIFVISCLLLAISNGLEPSQFNEFEGLAHKLFDSSWVVWLTMVVSLLMMLAFGVASLRKQIVAMIIGLAGTLFILLSSAVQLNWLVMMILIFAVLIPAGNVAFSKMTGTPSKSQL